MTDPIDVLRRVRRETQARKAGGGAAPLEALSEVAELLPGAARRVVARTAARAARSTPWSPTCRARRSSSTSSGAA